MGLPTSDLLYLTAFIILEGSYFKFTIQNVWHGGQVHISYQSMQKQARAVDGSGLSASHACVLYLHEAWWALEPVWIF